MNRAQRWSSLVAELGCAPGPAGEVFADVVARYGEPQRHYHTAAHLDAVLAMVDELGGGAPRADTRLAVWFHDVIYDPTAADNEELSAVLAREQLGGLGVDAAVIGAVERMIRATKTHQPSEDPEAALMLDADLAILGAPPAVYDRYAAAIRLEYAHVSDDAYRTGRAQVLESFRLRPRVFLTPAGIERLEANARANLQRELAALRA